MVTHDLFFYILIAFACSSLMAGLLYSWILKHGYNEDVNVFGLSSEGRSQQKGISLGGMILVPCVIVGVCLSMVLMSEVENVVHSIKTSTLLLGCGVMSVYLIGLLNDFYGLSVKVRLLIQILASLTLPLCGLVLADLFGFIGIGAEVHHLCDGFRDLGTEHRHDIHTKEIKHCSHNNCRPSGHTPGNHTGCNGIGRIRPAIDQNHAKGQRNRNKEQGVGCHLAPKIRQ